MTDELSDERRETLREFIEPFKVAPGSAVRLPDDFDPDQTEGIKNKHEGKELLEEGVELLSRYQARLAAQDTWGVLVVLQAMDAAGKDGTIRHVMSGVNPQGVEVPSFKVPSPEEQDHDFLWRYAQRLPARGRSGSSTAPTTRRCSSSGSTPSSSIAQQLPAGAKGDDVWKRRYRQINDWERYLTENGIRVVKLFLNVSKEEQRKRFLRRIDRRIRTGSSRRPTSPSAGFWDDYQHAYSEMLSHTSTEWAPWHVIPADRKWFARLASRPRRSSTPWSRSTRAFPGSATSAERSSQRPSSTSKGKARAPAPDPTPAQRSPPEDGRSLYDRAVSAQRCRAEWSTSYPQTYAKRWVPTRRLSRPGRTSPPWLATSSSAGWRTPSGVHPGAPHPAHPEELQEGQRRPCCWPGCRIASATAPDRGVFRSARELGSAPRDGPPAAPPSRTRRAMGPAAAD